MTAPECAGCPLPDQVAALELVRLREGIGRLAESYEAAHPEGHDIEGLEYYSNAYREAAHDLRALLDDNQGDSC